MKMLLLAALSILTLSRGEVQLPIENIRSITYNKTTGAEMYVHTTTGTQTYPLQDIVKMTLSDMPQPSAVESITSEEAKEAQKVLVNGTVYIIKDGRIYTLKGETVQ